MKLSLDASLTAASSITSDSLALSAWYDAHPGVRRLWAIRDAQALRVIVTLEPTVDDSDTYPAWFANSRKWTREMQASTGRSVRLELLDEPSTDAIEIDVEGEVVVAMSWRDPTSSTSFDQR